jgi:GNAT superfamily N-acetyltransferase
MPHIGRLLTASRHQAITEVLPERLEFYESWLRSETVRERGFGMAPMSAVLGFLRTEPLYSRVMARAGALAAEWTIASMPPMRRRGIGLLPRPCLVRAALRVAARIVREICSVSRASARVRRTVARLDVRASLFCTVRQLLPLPLCGFYVAVAASTLEGFGLPGKARVERCHAVDGQSCVIALDLSRTDAASDPAIAA